MPSLRAMALAKLTLCAMSFALVSPTAHAAIVLQATRIIFDAKDKEAGLQIRNTGDDESLVQSWIVPHDNADDTPFALVPPLARVPAGGNQLLRVLYEGSGLPLDRESIAWLHVQDVPRNTGGGNVLQFAVRHAIKIFYRPRELPGTADAAPRQLSWRVLRDGNATTIEVANPTAFHVSMVGLRLDNPAGGTEVATAYMIAPLASHRFTLDGGVSADRQPLSFTSINDFGGSDRFTVELRENAPANAQPVDVKER